MAIDYEEGKNVSSGPNGEIRVPVQPLSALDTIHTLEELGGGLLWRKTGDGSIESEANFPYSSPVKWVTEENAQIPGLDQLGLRYGGYREVVVQEYVAEEIDDETGEVIQEEIPEEKEFRHTWIAAYQDAATVNADNPEVADPRYDPDLEPEENWIRSSRSWTSPVGGYGYDYTIGPTLSHDYLYVIWTWNMGETWETLAGVSLFQWWNIVPGASAFYNLDDLRPRGDLQSWKLGGLGSRYSLQAIPFGDLRIAFMHSYHEALNYKGVPDVWEDDYPGNAGYQNRTESWVKPAVVGPPGEPVRNGATWFCEGMTGTYIGGGKFVFGLMVYAGVAYAYESEKIAGSDPVRYRTKRYTWVAGLGAPPIDWAAGPTMTGEYFPSFGSETITYSYPSNCTCNPGEDNEYTLTIATPGIESQASGIAHKERLLKNIASGVQSLGYVPDFDPRFHSQAGLDAFSLVRIGPPGQESGDPTMWWASYGSSAKAFLICQGSAKTDSAVIRIEKVISQFNTTHNTFGNYQTWWQFHTPDSGTGTKPSGILTRQNFRALPTYYLGGSTLFGQGYYKDDEHDPAQYIHPDRDPIWWDAVKVGASCSDYCNGTHEEHVPGYIDGALYDVHARVPYLGTGPYPMISTDLGKSWENITVPDDFPTLSYNTVQLVPIGNGKAICIADQALYRLDGLEIKAMNPPDPDPQDPDAVTYEPYDFDMQKNITALFGCTAPGEFLFERAVDQDEQGTNGIFEEVITSSDETTVVTTNGYQVQDDAEFEITLDPEVEEELQAAAEAAGQEYVPWIFDSFTLDGDYGQILKISPELPKTRCKVNVKFRNAGGHKLFLGIADGNKIIDLGWFVTGRTQEGIFIPTLTGGLTGDADDYSYPWQGEGAADPETLSFLTTELPGGYKAESYIATVVAQGGTSPYTYEDISPEGDLLGLPPGLELDTTNGQITGYPTDGGEDPDADPAPDPATVKEWTVTIKVTDAQTSGDPQTVEKEFKILVIDRGSFAITSDADLGQAILFQSFQAQVTVAGGVEPILVLVEGLPMGIGVENATADGGAITISGEPMEGAQGDGDSGQSYTLFVQAIDDEGNEATQVAHMYVHPASYELLISHNGWDQLPDPDDPLGYVTVSKNGGAAEEIQLSSLSNELPLTKFSIEAFPLDPEEYEFDSWSGDVEGTENPVVIEELTRHTQVQPEFVPVGEGTPVDPTVESHSVAFYQEGWNLTTKPPPLMTIRVTPSDTGEEVELTLDENSLAAYLQVEENDYGTANIQFTVVPITDPLPEGYGNPARITRIYSNKSQEWTFTGAAGDEASVGTISVVDGIGLVIEYEIGDA